VTGWSPRTPASWRRWTAAAGSSQGSHGCVHVPLAMMRWLFGWARLGTWVVIQR
jgi:lipoprotein-anchoring transpeptidase ErfK/SrfK